ncbi:hypothetical protein PE067_09520 [Paracoccus sp. DMF-8]|uniref:hypothetical protein n=1 Tax=Paracoccus sp. DMF-8 TaxID=3019445 RepID=UPI0023E7E6AA|nr:hypothetical protein [Paracoccus sp. DMF-8]MDF3606358.1 hypothetical protein [Paracoccus sp. DMF-8]
MGDSITVEGFVIVPPLSPWDEKHRDEIWSHMGPPMFGTSEAEAWRRHHFKGGDAQAFSQHVQYWFGRGYRVKKARIEIDP